MLAKSEAEVTVTLPSDREIAFTRIFERPRRLLFEAWTKPERLRQWWGCEGRGTGPTTPLVTLHRVARHNQ
jgi:uncharacterized protein YndB with AHSA1/START domain